MAKSAPALILQGFLRWTDSGKNCGKNFLKKLLTISWTGDIICKLSDGQTQKTKEH